LQSMECEAPLAEAELYLVMFGFLYPEVPLSTGVCISQE
jgi:hypothetical protein